MMRGVRPNQSKGARALFRIWDSFFTSGFRTPIDSMKHTKEWKRYKRPPSEQEYSDDVSCIHHGLNVEPTSEELSNLSKACSRLWELDLNPLVPGKDYMVKCGEGKKVYQKGYMASENLLTTTTSTKDTRKVTQQDKHEEDPFIEEIARSAPMKYLHRYLVLKGITYQDYENFQVNADIPVV